MAKVLCLFSVVCDPNEHLLTGCPFHLASQANKRGFISKSCFTWNNDRETAKERRLRYAQEKRNRRETAGSEGQA
jgi:hypothetical protein